MQVQQSTSKVTPVSDTHPTFHSSFVTEGKKAIAKYLSVHRDHFVQASS